MEDFLDDRVIIPDKIKRMSREERRAEIKRLEKIAAEEKERIRRNKKEKVLV
ncbi:MAG: hypothetical protein IJ736_05900 [Firmicutes bacterium]|nr:hypothetical protein [Bacillota bacterium]